jgi:hypothetical protein
MIMFYNTFELQAVKNVAEVGFHRVSEYEPNVLTHDKESSFYFRQY